MKIIECSTDTSYKIPFFAMKVQAGFPSPADGALFNRLDLNKHLIKNPTATFFVQVTGESMIDAGIKENDILVVDKSLEPANNHIVIAVLNNEFTVKRLKIDTTGMYLVAENKAFPSLKIDEDCYICGVVTSVIHQL